MHKLINTGDYLLIVNDLEIKEGDIYCRIDTGLLFSSLKGSNPNIIEKYCKKIIAHLPLNNSPILEGVDLLPPIEDNNNEVWNQGLEAELNKLPYTKHLDDGQYNDGQLAGFEFGATWGYNKAKEKYKYTEEDIEIAIKKAVKLGNLHDPIKAVRDITYSLQQPKMPVSFLEKGAYNGTWVGEYIF